MKISQLIQILVTAWIKYGDLPLTVDNYSESLSSEDIFVVHCFKNKYGDEHIAIQEYADEKDFVIK